MVELNSLVNARGLATMAGRCPVMRKPLADPMQEEFETPQHSNEQNLPNPHIKVKSLNPFLFF